MTELRSSADSPTTAVPPVNVYEAGGELSVAIPIPGAHADNVNVRLATGRLRVDAVCKYPQDRQRTLRHDWRVGDWTLDLPLPRRVDPSGGRATLNLGVLVVMAPESEAGGDERRLPVEAGG